ncbi:MULTISPECIES: hypothetical protein [Cellulomonas]|uniref:hypothetical protein n=1 Tax=Cellulomonas TaxID=1707 RepID=UPI0014562CB5|nr:MULTISPECIES: hypothetical protein [Cellulomonas]
MEELTSAGVAALREQVLRRWPEEVQERFWDGPVWHAAVPRRGTTVRAEHLEGCWSVVVEPGAHAFETHDATVRTLVRLVDAVVRGDVWVVRWQVGRLASGSWLEDGEGERFTGGSGGSRLDRLASSVPGYRRTRVPLPDGTREAT